ncbi:MAG: flagellar motor switch protein FliN [Deltaproteobacteria bacterium RIFOXYD12_FULL_50_9]|nr:MAG: flagellar motor switch protein FliN [Deltaproteobacteria bacterium RIFOXYD12_FULL_50_9]
MADNKGPSANDDDWAAALSEQTGSGQAKPAEFQELGEGMTGSGGGQNMDFLLDLPLSVTVELGKTTMIIHKLLQLTQGSVVELEKASGEPVEIYINRKLLGKGEVVVVNDRFGIRITEIISQADRIKNMG